MAIKFLICMALALSSCSRKIYTVEAVFIIKDSQLHIVRVGQPTRVGDTVLRGYQIIRK